MTARKLLPAIAATQSVRMAPKAVARARVRFDRWFAYKQVDDRAGRRGKNVSDIAIRFDGLLLGLFILAGAGIFGVIAFVAALRASLTRPSGKRTWKVMSYSLWLVVAHAAALALLLGYLRASDSVRTGPDWVDWLAIPWSCVILAGMVVLLRQRRSGDEEGPSGG
ncbi:hypothetical protein BH10PSE14_BH10PSE14_26010 [soil metagenome]